MPKEKIDLNYVRKELHKIPELGFQEFKTQKLLISLLEKFAKIKIHRFDSTGIVVEYTQNAGDYLLFRADMDGLPLPEKTNCSFKSIHPEKMHACGHDIHMTILIGLIEKVIENSLQKNILFLFQPGEEGFGGAKKIIETGIFANFSIAGVYSLHVSGKLPVGSVAAKTGIFFAFTEIIKITFSGKNAHVAFADNGTNALAAGVTFYSQVQNKLKINFTNSDKIACEFGTMSAGTATNAIPDSCVLTGSIRSFTEKNQNLLKNLISESAQFAQTRHNTEFQIEYSSFYPPVFNSQNLLQNLEVVAEKLNLDLQPCEPQLTGEDFAFFTKKYPGILFWLGAQNKNGADLHSSTFLADEKAIPVGVDIFYNLICL